MPLRPFLVTFLLVACSTAPKGPGGSGGSTGGGGSSGGSQGGAVPGSALFGRLAGLWSGQAGQTPLGSFPIMNMDFRAAGTQWLFGRVDLDAQNNLRYGFAVEEVAGQPALVYRNGGYFQGTLRDLTTVLHDHDDAAGTYHFCAPDPVCLYVNGSCIQEQGGCAFVDAVFTFSAPDQLVFNAHVNGQEHLVWTATRLATRTLPAPFPSDPTPLPGDADWPAMPQLAAAVAWGTPLDAGANVWVILSDTPCASPGSLGFTCTPSRALSTYADAGATGASLLFDQIHAGNYAAVALLDVAGGFGTVSFSPGPGDGVSDPSASVTVPASGEGSAALPIVYYLP